MADTVAQITPNRKRKREIGKVIEKQGDSCFINPAFNSSTPKKLVGRRRLIPEVKENINPLNDCMEVKSISELVNNKKCEPAADIVPYNPFEVQRKPPKKKKREMSIEEACFENPALNLNVPEKQLNPYEVVRDVSKNYEEQSRCFVNAALDIKGKDFVVKMRNPFEIERENMESNLKEDLKIGYENLGLKNAQPTSLKLGIPFTPTVGCRIDFKNIPLNELTPSKLMFSEKLIFSPVPPVNGILPKRSLDAISEESSSVSIGKELDRYQLELENSINEAKMRKNDNLTDDIVSVKECANQLQLKIEKRRSFGTKLSDIAEIEECEIETLEEIKITVSETSNVETLTGKQLEMPQNKTEHEKSIEKNCPAESNEGFSFDSDDDGTIDLKAPAPFRRAYRRDRNPKHISKESLQSNNFSKSSTEDIAAQNNCKKQNMVKNLIRRSIRKILPNNHHHHNEVETEVNSDLKEMPKEHYGNDDGEKPYTITSHIMSSLRQSLRRRPKQKDDTSEQMVPLAEISIIDPSERKMKLKSSVTQNEFARIEQLTNEKKHFLRQGSFSHSTRGMRQQLMKSLFQHKEEEYTFKK